MRVFCRRASRIVLAMSMVAIWLVAVTPAVPAHAAGSITLEKESAGTVLFGGEATFSLTAGNPVGSVELYNLSFRDVLPFGVSYVKGSSSAPAGEPGIIVVTDPISGESHQVLLWENVSDLTGGSTQRLTFRAAVDPDVHGIGDTVSNSASVHASSDPREVPTFDDAGDPEPGDVVSATDSTTTTVSAIRIEKSSDAPDSELLRGVNEHPSRYTLKVTNNLEGPTSDIEVIDYLPATLEFLGCGGAFAGDPEYPGAAHQASPLAGCVEPVRVETVADPAGLPAGVYTQVVWRLPAALAAEGVAKLTYLAGVPQRANTLDFGGATPSPTGLGQTANLDNNTGASTREMASERSAVNRASASGTFAELPVSDSTTHTVTLEDLRLLKKVNHSTFSQGQLAEYTLTIDTGEYADLDDLEITDVIPAGLCPIDADQNWTTLSECAASAGHAPVNATITDVVANADGSFTVTLIPDRRTLATNETFTIRYFALMRRFSDPASNSPTSAEDEFTNSASITGTSTPAEGVNTPDAGAVTVADTATSTIGSDGPALTKLRMRNATPMECSTAMADYADDKELAKDPEVAFAMGDRVCFWLRVTFPAGVDTRNAQLTDFLPPYVSYESATQVSAVPVPIAGTAPAAPSSYVTWTLGSGSPRVVARESVFDIVLAGRVTSPVKIGSGNPKATISANLAKFRYTNSQNRSSSLRDSVEVPLSPPPVIGITKAVAAIDGTLVAEGPADPVTLTKGGQSVTYQVAVRNLAQPGAVDALAILSPRVWDLLPEGITCAAVTTPLLDGGQCFDAGQAGRPNVRGNTSASVIRWELPETFVLEAQQTRTLTYTLTLPDSLSVSLAAINTAAVTQYQTRTNVPLSQPTTDSATHYPASNVSGDVLPAQEDVPSARDTATVNLPPVTLAKTATTDIVDTGNTAAQAVPGEGITYTIRLEVPAHTSLYRATLAEVLPSQVEARPATPATAVFLPDAATETTAPWPSGVVLATNGGLTFPAAGYTNATATPQAFVITIPARVKPGSTATAAQTNQATFTSFATPTGGSAFPVVQASAIITPVQASPSFTKTNNSATGQAGGLVTFTLTAYNQRVSATAARPSLHDVVVVDCLPAGFVLGAVSAPVGTSTIALAAGETGNTCATGRAQLTWTVGTLTGNGTATVNSRILTYTARVPDAAGGGTSFVNNATLTGSTLPNGANTAAVERVHTLTGTSTVAIPGSTITKSPTTQTATVGQRVSWTVTASFLPFVNYYNAAIIDTLPAGFDPESLEYQVTGGDAGLIAATSLLPRTGQKIGWRLGTLGSSAQTRTLTITYSALVQDQLGVSAGATLTNEAVTAWNIAAGVDPATTGAAFQRTSTTPGRGTVTVVEPALTIDKSPATASAAPGDVIDYTLTVRNNGRASNLSPAHSLTVVDTLPAQVVPVPGSFGDGVHNAGERTITWTIPGPLAANDAVTRSYQVRWVDSASLSAPVTNTATVPSYRSLAEAGRAYTHNPSDTATLTPLFPHVSAGKSVQSGPAYVGEAKTWTITLTNDGTALAHDVTATDTLPPHWSYVAGSGRVTLPGGSAQVLNPATGPSGELVWGSGLGWQLAATNPDSVITLTYQAVPGSGVLSAVPPLVGSTTLHTNQVAVAATDATGATASGAGSYTSGPATAATSIHSADLSLVKSAGTATAGRPLDFTLTVANSGPDTAVGPFQVVDQLPSGLGAVTATGTGWSCTVVGSPAEVNCRRTNPADTLASGASFPAITITAQIPAATNAGTEFANTATVSARTHDPVIANDTGSATATVARQADLRLVKRASGAFVAGAQATYTLDVTNLGPSDSRGPLKIVDTLPEHTSFVSVRGAWDCDTAPGGVLTCTTDDGLALNGSDQLTVVVAIDANHTGTVENTATVTGRETDPVPANNTSAIVTAVATSADLQLAKDRVGEFTAGMPGTYRFTVYNKGPSWAAAPVVTDELPAGLTFVSGGSAHWNCAAASGVVTCTRDGRLADGAEESFEVKVVIASGHTAPIVNTARVDSITADPLPTNNAATHDSGIAVSADLRITKSHQGNAVAGQPFEFSVDVANLGPSDHPGPITVTDTLPEGMAPTAAHGAGWECGIAAQRVTCVREGLLGDESDTSTITIEVDVAPQAGPAVLRNVASVTSAVPDPRITNNTTVDEVTVVDRAEVRITKSAASTAIAGEALTYTLRVANSGPSDADSVRIVDPLATGLTLIEVGEPTGWECTDAVPVTCETGTLAAGAAATITVRVGIDHGVLDGSVIENRAVVSTSTTGDDPEDNEANHKVAISARADLGIVKTHAEDTVAAGESVSFTMAVTNHGPSDAQGPLRITDTLPEGLSLVGTDGPWTCTSPPETPRVISCLLDEVVPAGASAPVLELTARVDSALDPELMLDKTLVNAADVESQTTDPVPDNDTTTDPVQVRFVADLSLTKVHSGPVRIGDHLAFTLQLHNAGPSVARSVELVDTLPDGLTYLSATGDGWTCADSGQEITCALADQLASQAAAAPITVTVAVTAEAYPTVTNRAVVNSDAEDPRPEDNTAIDPVTIPAQVDLSLTKAHTPETLTVGEQGTWTITVSNAGPTDDPGPVVVKDLLPHGLSFVSASGEGWTCASTEQEVACERPAGLGSGKSSAVEVVLAVGAQAYPAITNTATVTSPAEDLDPTNNVASDPAPVLPAFDLSMEKSLAWAKRREVVWTIEVTNSGPNAAPVGSVVVTDVMPPELELTAASGPDWDCQTSQAAATCMVTAPLASGASAELVVRTRIVAGTSGTVTNTATLEDVGTDLAGVEVNHEGEAELPFTGSEGALGLLAFGLMAMATGILVVRRRE